MTLFNFNGGSEQFDDYNNDEEEIECQCEECSLETTIGMTEYFVTEALGAKSVEHLGQVLFQFAEIAKIQGIKEYLFSTTEANMETMLVLDSVTNNFFNKKASGLNQSDDFYNGNSDYGHWKDRL